MSFPRLCAAAVLAAAALLRAQPLAATPVNLDDLLSAEDLGQVAVDPTGRWLVIEHQGPYEAAPRFDDDTALGVWRTRLERIDLTAPGRPVPLFPPQSGTGYAAGPFSPSGRAMLVYRLSSRGWEAGVVEVASGAVRWLGLTPEYALLGRTAQWRSEHELVLIARADGDTPVRLRRGHDGSDRLTELWANQAKGRRPAASLIGSGRFLGLRPRAEARRLVYLDLRGGAARTLATGEFFDLELSPDGRYVAAILDGEDLQPAAEARVRVASAERRRNVTVVDLVSGAVETPCPDCDIATHLLAWSPGSDGLLVLSRPVGGAWTSGAVMRLSPRGGGAPLKISPSVQFTHEGYAYSRATWAADAPVVLGGPIGDEGWYRLDRDGPKRLAGPEADLVAADGVGVWFSQAAGLRRIPTSSAQGSALEAARRVPAGGPGQGDRARLNPNPSKEAYVVRQASGSRRYGLAGGPTVAVTPEGWRTLAVSRAGAIAEQVSDKGVLRLAHFAADGALIPLLTLNSDLAGRDWAPARPVVIPDPTGKLRTSWLYRPAAIPPGKASPLVVIAYPGSVLDAPLPAYGSGPASFSTSPQALAALGYAVLVVSLPRDPTGEPAAGLADQILTIVDAAVAQGGIDPHRLALWGHSFGGYGALVVATQTSRFAAIIAAAGPADLASFYGGMIPRNRVRPADGLDLTFGPGWAEQGQAALGVPPWRDPERYRRNSPLFAADRITAPILLIHGDQDIVGFEQSGAMFAALYRQAKDAALLTLWGEGHLVVSPANLRTQYQTVDRFLAAAFGP